jgi:hypothetical protein
VALADVARDVGEVVRRADIAREHRKAPRQRMPLGDGDPARNSRLGGTARSYDDGFVERRAPLFSGRRCLKLLELPRSRGDAGRDRLGVIG